MSNRKKKADLRNQQNAKKKKIMIGIIAAVVVIAVIVSVICIVNCTSGKKEDSVKLPSVAGNIVEREAVEVSKVEISNGEITYTLNNEVGFGIEGYESELLLNTDLAINVFSVTTAIPYTEKIDSISSLADYGLDNTDKSVTVFYKDGTQFKLLLGKEASEFEYYAMAENDTCVYKIPAEIYEAMMKHPGEFRDTDVCTIYQENATIDVEYFTIYRNGKKEVTVEKDRNFVPTNDYQTTSYIVTYPYNNENAALGVLWYMFDNIPEKIVADSVVEENPSDLSKYGLSPAVFSLELTDTNGTNVLKFGNDKDGKTYFMCNDNPVVYLMESPLYNIIREYKASTYLEGYIGLYNIADVSSIVVAKGDESHTMAIVEDNGTTSYMIDDIVKQEKEFKSVYQSVIAVSAKDFVEETPAGELYAEITFKFKDGTSETAEYYIYDENYCIAEAMNGLNGLVLKADIDALVDTLVKEN